MNYNCDVKKVDINGRDYDAYFPKKHTTLRGIISNFWREDDWDGYGPTQTHYLKIFILRKRKENWENLYKGLYHKAPGEYQVGDVNGLLFNFEKESFKNIYLAQEKINTLENSIEKDKKELRLKRKELKKLLSIND